MNRIRRRRRAGFRRHLRMPHGTGRQPALVAVVLLLVTVAVLPAGAQAAPAVAAAQWIESGQWVEAGPGAPRPAGSRFEPEWSWPLSPAPPVLRFFQAPAQRWLPGHRGVDLPAEPGTPLLSPGSGTVVFAGWVVNRPVMTVDLGAGVLASFEPVQAVQPSGSVVAEGMVIGHIASPADPGHCPASCLHWGVRLHGTYVNPLSYVTDRRPSVLLPLR